MLNTALLISSLLLAGTDPANATAAPPRRVEVCFVLDTTGSMASLIDTAKDRIWFIAKEIVRAPSTPSVRFCLLGYRDRGDDYVTRHYPLTDDLDAIHAALLDFEADGGGDMPEAVTQALLEAVDDSGWSADPGVLKLIFLVGDAPPHEDYDEPQYPVIARRAAQRGIVINPVQVGRETATRATWESIARSAGGRSVTLDPAAREGPTATPMDQDLAALAPRLEGSVIAYGPADVQTAHAERVERIAGLGEATAADRVSYTVTTSPHRNDLIQLLERGEVDLAALERSWLPDAIRSMTEDELHEHLATVRDERAELRRIIARLVGEREAWLGSRRDGNGFEAVVAALVMEQLQASGRD